MRQKGEAIPFVALLFIWSSDHQPSCHIKSSLRSKRFRAVSEERTRKESQTPRENGASKRSGRGPKIPFLDLSLLRNQTETFATQAI